MKRLLLIAFVICAASAVRAQAQAPGCAKSDLLAALKHSEALRGESESITGTISHVGSITNGPNVVISQPVYRLPEPPQTPESLRALADEIERWQKVEAERRREEAARRQFVKSVLAACAAEGNQFQGRGREKQ